MNVHAKKILQTHRCSSQFFWGGGKHVQKNADMSSPLAAELPWWTSAEPDELAPIITEVKNGENDGSRAEAKICQDSWQLRFATKIPLLMV